MGTASIRRVNARLMIYTLRGLEFLLPVWCLIGLLGPAAGVVAGWQLLRAKSILEQFDRLLGLAPQSEPISIWRIWRHWTRVNMTKLLTAWPDRLADPRWRRRGRCIGLEQLEQAAASERPVILATVHYGPLAVLHYWLRAGGLPTAALVYDAANHLSVSKRLKQLLSDQATGLADVPHVFNVHQLRAVFKFLQQPRLLIVAVDDGRGELPPVAGLDFSLRMATGAVRLAARVNAVVVPCLIRADRSMAFTIHFGAAVPDACVADQRQHPAALVHLLQVFLPLLRAYPEQCAYSLLRCIQTSAPPADGAGDEIARTIP
jgi:lauroyl/myristoyl acyltransferase